MATFTRRMARSGNQIGVWMYRAFAGRLASYNKGAKVLMITSPGRRTGVLHSTCVRYLQTPQGYVVWGTASGAPSDPDWFRNLRKAKTADVQIGANTLQVRPRELLAGERDATWRNVVLAEAPEVEKIAKRAGRTIPVALLQPVEAPPRRAKVD